MTTILGQKSSVLLGSEDLYHQWLEYLTDIETSRLAIARGRGRLEAPEQEDALVGYVDPLRNLNKLVKTVLPHLTISDIDFRERMLYVHSGDKRIPFGELSSGEREVIFLSGQIDRLRLTSGVLLIDEPELHLNPDLIRRFISVIQETSADGQLWMATHSFEAVEAAGTENTYVVTRDLGTTSIDSLEGKPVVAALTAALGRSGFSIANKRFVIVEGGKKSLRERTRFDELCSSPTDVAFIGVGEHKSDVLRLFGELQVLAEATGEQLHIRAIVDADFCSVFPDDRNEERVYRLPVHEIENLFLDPESLAAAAKMFLGVGDPFDAELVVKTHSDSMAGRWVWSSAQYSCNAKWRAKGILGGIGPLQGKVATSSWDDIHRNWDAVVAEARLIDYELGEDLIVSRRLYESVRSTPELWMHCFGKEVLNKVATGIGFKNGGRLEQAIVNAWNEGRIPRPSILQDLRRFLEVS